MSSICSYISYNIKKKIIDYLEHLNYLDHHHHFSDLMLRMILGVIVVKYEPPVRHQVFALFLAMTCHILPGQCHTHAMSGTLDRHSHSYVCK